MGDPRNVAHNKKVIQEKHHKGAVPAPQPGKKAKTQPIKKQPVAAEESSAVKLAQTAPTGPKPDATKLEKSLAILAKLREMEFHSRGNIEKLAELSLTIEDELKQKNFVESINGLYAAQEAFHSKSAVLIEAYAAECERLKPAG
jgi:hypothetical protein